MSDVEAAVARGHAPYAERLADRSYWDEILPIEAVRLLLTGWEGLSGDPPRAGPTGVAPSELSRIPRAHLEWFGLQALRLFAPTEDEEKN